MKTIYVAGSFKDLDTSRQAAREIEKLGFQALISAPGDPKGIDGCFERIEMADAIYVSNPRGETGKSVSLDLGFAIARRKPIFTMKPITDPPISHRTKVIAELKELTASLEMLRK